MNCFKCMWNVKKGFYKVVRLSRDNFGVEQWNGEKESKKSESGYWNMGKE